MLARESPSQPIPQYMNFNSPPETIMSNPNVMSTLIQESKPEPSPQKVSVAKIKQSSQPSAPTKKRDAKENELKAEEDAERPKHHQKPNKKEAKAKEKESDVQPNRIMDNESLIEKAKRLLKKTAANFKRNLEENNKRAKTGESSEVIVNSTDKDNLPDELNPS